MHPENLKELGVEYIRFYTHTTPVVNNVFTACILMNEDKELLARGVSICSVLDTYRKKAGKNKALGRAIRALRTEETSLPINLVNVKTKNAKKKKAPRWYGEMVGKSFKMKSKNETQYFRDEIVPILAELETTYRFVDVNVGGKKRTKALFSLPKIYPLVETAKVFKFKSFFRPKATTLEKAIIGNI